LNFRSFKKIKASHSCTFLVPLPGFYLCIQLKKIGSHYYLTATNV